MMMINYEWSPAESNQAMTARGSNVITDLLRDSILRLCKSNVLYDGQVEVDGIICISGQVEGQQLVVKVHETFESFTSPGCKVDGGRRFENDRGDGSFLGWWQTNSVSRSKTPSSPEWIQRWLIFSFQPVQPIPDLGPDDSRLWSSSKRSLYEGFSSLSP